MTAVQGWCKIYWKQICHYRLQGGKRREKDKKGRTKKDLWATWSPVRTLVRKEPILRLNNLWHENMCMTKNMQQIKYVNQCPSHYDYSAQKKTWWPRNYELKKYVPATQVIFLSKNLLYLKKSISFCSFWWSCWDLNPLVEPLCRLIFMGHEMHLKEAPWPWCWCQSLPMHHGSCSWAAEGMTCGMEDGIQAERETREKNKNRICLLELGLGLSRQSN
jgi:hypothetical protein